MLCLVPLLLGAAGGHDLGKAVDGGADTAERCRVHAEQQLGERSGARARTGGRGRAGSLVEGGRAMGHPVVDEQRDEGVAGQVVCLLGRVRGGHDDGRVRRVGRRRQVGVVHEGDVRYIVGCRREMELRRGSVERGVGSTAEAAGAYKAGVLQTDGHLFGQAIVGRHGAGVMGVVVVVVVVRRLAMDIRCI